MIKLNNSVSYATSILLQVLGESRQGPVTARRISHRCKFPPRFLYRVLRRLVDAGMLRAVSGPHGGYTLARPARSITLLDIVTAVESPSEPLPLVAACPKHKRAIKQVNVAAKQIAESCSKRLRRVTLAKLARSK